MPLWQMCQPLQALRGPVCRGCVQNAQPVPTSIQQHLYKNCHISSSMSREPTPDPVPEPLWRSMRLLPARMDRDIDRIYHEAKLDVNPNCVMELLHLDTRGPMTISELAAT